MSAQNRRVKNLKADGETLTRAATARDGELVIETVPLQRAHSATDKDPRQRFWGSFTKGQKGSQRQLTQAALQVAPAIAVNLRDIGKVSDIVKSGILFRSSELIRYQLAHHVDGSGEASLCMPVALLTYVCICFQCSGGAAL